MMAHKRIGNVVSFNLNFSTARGWVLYLTPKPPFAEERLSCTHWIGGCWLSPMSVWTSWRREKLPLSPTAGPCVPVSSVTDIVMRMRQISWTLRSYFISHRYCYAHAPNQLDHFISHRYCYAHAPNQLGPAFLFRQSQILLCACAKSAENVSILYISACFSNLYGISSSWWSWILHCVTRKIVIEYYVLLKLLKGK